MAEGKVQKGSCIHALPPLAHAQVVAAGSDLPVTSPRYHPYLLHPHSPHSLTAPCTSTCPGRGHGLCFVSEAYKRATRENMLKVPETGSLTGSDSDLRKLSAETATNILLSFGVDRSIISQQTNRWVRRNGGGTATNTKRGCVAEGSGERGGFGTVVCAGLCSLQLSCSPSPPSLPVAPDQPGAPAAYAERSTKTQVDLNSLQVAPG